MDPPLRPRSEDPKALLRRLPAVERILEHGELSGSHSRFGRGVVALHVRRELNRQRQAILRGELSDTESLDQLASRLKALIARDAQPLPRILNATGVVLHSGLGRAPIPAVAAEAIQRAAGYSLLEVDRHAGDRLARDKRIGFLLEALTGAKASLVVNNNAAATLLILSALARGKEVLCSHGELVEIGGSFRIPDVMEASGCRLVAVGTTNKTHLADYERAITDRTGALLVVHTSNYRIVGFTSQPKISEVAALAKSRGLPMIHDIGSGSLLSPEEFGLGDEPPVGRSLEDGADVVCMSGDKLLGGPQAGIILGREDLIETMRRHPLARAVRIDKMTVAALEATLALYCDRARLKVEHPVFRMLTSTVDELRPRAEALQMRLEGFQPIRAKIIELTSEAGSGALPALPIPSIGVSLETALPAGRFSKRLREANPGVFTRIIEDRVCLDVRTLLPGEEHEAADVIRSIFL